MNYKFTNIDKYNVIQDDENYYFFRALNMEDNRDVEQGITIDENGKIKRIRTDSQRYEGEAKYSESSKISLEEMIDHIKIHYRRDTNCISLTTNANIAVKYGSAYHKDKYVMIKISKKEFGEKVVFAGEYMLQEIYSRIKKEIVKLPQDEKQKILNTYENIDRASDDKTLKDIITLKYKGKLGKIIQAKTHLRKKIVYKASKSRICNYQLLEEEQLLEVNKIYSKLAILENKNILKHIISHLSNSKIRETIGRAFSSAEVIHYGEIKQEEIIEIPKEIVDIFAKIQHR